MHWVYIWFLMGINHAATNSDINLYLNKKTTPIKQIKSLDLVVPMKDNYIFRGEMYDFLKLYGGVKFVFPVKNTITISLQLKFPAVGITKQIKK